MIQRSRPSTNPGFNTSLSGVHNPGFAGFTETNPDLWDLDFATPEPPEAPESDELTPAS